MGITKNHIHSREHIELASFFLAFAHPARIAIIDALTLDEKLNCNDLRKHIQLAQSTISAHLKIMHSVGLLGVCVEGSNGYYVVSNLALQEIKSYVEILIEKVKSIKKDWTNVYSRTVKFYYTEMALNTT